MPIKRRTKVKAEFSMASLTDIIFLLLIFFMLTSSFVMPNALRLLLPKATSQQVERQTLSVSITPALEYYVNKIKVSENRLQQEIMNQMKGPAEETTIVVNADKSVPVEHVVNVMVVAKNLNAKVILATQPE
jgi:biopolymer transport protein ExbD